MEDAVGVRSEVKWDYEAFNPLIPPKEKTWPDQARDIKRLRETKRD